MSHLLHDFVAAQAARTPEAVAVQTGEARTTFAELESQANQIARVLRDQGCRRGDRVCALGPLTASGIAALLGVLKADAIYVPLNATETAVALARAVEACQPACILTATATARVVDGLFAAGAAASGQTLVGSLERSPIAGQQFFTNFSLADARQASGRAVASRNRPTSPATLVFKSASPSRGVVTTHAALSRSVAWAKSQFDVVPEGRHAVARDWSDDRALFAIVTALAGGSMLVPAPEGAVPAWRVLEFLRRSAVSHWYATAAELAEAAAADVVLPADLPALRSVMWWTDAVSPRAVQYWRRRVSHARFTSLYGAPEAATVSAYRTWRDETAPGGELPIGIARPGQDVVVLNGEHEPVPAGETGEIWIVGKGLSPGYWANPGGTADAFRTHAENAGAWDRMWRTGDLGRRGTDGSLYLIRGADETWAGRQTGAAPAHDLGAGI